VKIHYDLCLFKSICIKTVDYGIGDGAEPARREGTSLLS